MLYSQKIQKAIRFSVKTHEVYQKQKRKGKDIPYITHPLIVGLILARAGASEDVIAAGILHDTIEDSIAEKKVTREMIAERFGEKVAELVLSVTESNKELSWEERKREALDHVETLQNESLLVKSADLISNISEIIADHQAGGDEIFERFNAPKEKIVRHYQNMISAVIRRWPENPLIEDLKNLDLYPLDGTRMAFVAPHGTTPEQVADEVLEAAAHPSHRSVSFSGEEYLELAKIIESVTGKGTVEADPKMVLVMGGVASGKTTIRRQKFNIGYVNFEYGEIYTAVKHAVGADHPRLRVYVNFICDSILQDALTEKKNLAVEIIGDEYEKLAPVIERMKRIGYKIA